MSLRSSAGTARLKLNADPCPACGGAGEVEHADLRGVCPACQQTGRFQGEARPLCANCSGTGLMHAVGTERSHGGVRPCITCKGKGLQGNPFSAYRGMMVGALVGCGYAGLISADLPGVASMVVLAGMSALFVAGVGGETLKRRKLRKARELTQLPPRGP